MENVAMNSFWKSKRVLVTGHTGFKGSWLSALLLDSGSKVAGLALEPDTDPSLFLSSKLDKDMESIFGDIRDLATVEKVFKSFKPEVVIHMAAQSLVRPSYSDPVGTFATNVMGTVHVLEASRKYSPRVVVNVTSDKCYENKERIKGYTEDESLGGADPYSASKGCAEIVSGAYLRSYFAQSQTNAASARAGNVIGGGDWSVDRLIPDMVRAFTSSNVLEIRNPESIRPWQHVLDPLSGYLHLAESLWTSNKNSGPWNFGPEDQTPVTVREVVSHFKKFWSKPGEIKFGNGGGLHEAKHLSLDCTKAKEKLHWTSRLNLQKSIELSATWYEKFYSGDNARKLMETDIHEFISAKGQR
jgi:CDP-glucose 4,6-dehydratase